MQDFQIGTTSFNLVAGATSDDVDSQRCFPEDSHKFRRPFQRDRDRIIHSRAFRRLANKTQVFLSNKGDHFRTRMTHTIEVTAIARTLARALGANEDLAEAIGLAHDLGHTPFGHVGERMLDRLLVKHGGFDHNRQSLRVVDLIEKKYPRHPGLNLTLAVRKGLVKHRENGETLDGERLPPYSSMEGQIADVADDIAYFSHDLDDGLRSGLLTTEILKGVELWEMAWEKALMEGGDYKDEYFPPFVVRCMIDLLAADVLAGTKRNLQEMSIRTPDGIQQANRRIVAFSPEFTNYAKKFRGFMFDNLYWHPDVLTLNQRAEQILIGLFEFFCSNPDKIGTRCRELILVQGIERSVADYLAGTTDGFAEQLYQENVGSL